MIEIGTRLQDRYLVKKQIGAGGMGAVYLAVDERFNNNVALKETFYKEEGFGAAFEREARLLNGLHHSALPHVSDYFTEKGEHFLVMQFIEGEDLFASLKDGKRFPIETVLHWTNELLDALDYLHSQNPPIIHRDIKPHNLKITPRGDIILLDFGLAKLESEESQNTASVFGYSRIYSPPEQIEDAGTDARSDIFSLGATGYHLLTGRPPIDALKRKTAQFSGEGDPLPPASAFNPEISLALDHILQTALALDPDERFKSARAMQTAIEYALDENLYPPADAGPIDANSVVNRENQALSLDENQPPTFPATGVFAPENPAHFSQHRIDVLLNESGPLNNSYPSPDYALTVLNNPENSYKRFIPVALLVLIFTGGLLAWHFVPQSETIAPVNQPTVAQSEPAALSPAVTASEAVELSKQTEQAEPIVEKAEKSGKSLDSLRESENRSFIAPKIQSITLPPAGKKSSVKLTATPVKENAPVAVVPPKSVPKNIEPKTTPKTSIASTTLIMIPSSDSGATRPRVISKRVAPQSSATEINRFFTGSPRQPK